MITGLSNMFYSETQSAQSTQLSKEKVKVRGDHTLRALKQEEKSGNTRIFNLADKEIRSLDRR